MTTRRAVALASLALLWASTSAAQETSAPLGRASGECVDRRAEARASREAGKLSASLEAFLACARASCPAELRAECGSAAAEVDRLLPTVRFGARDESGADVAGLQVSVDGSPLAPVIDPQRYPLDPGRHEVRLVAPDGREASLSIAVNAGEKARPVIAQLSANGAVSTATAPPPARRSLVPLAVAGVGGAAIVGGGVMLGVGLSRTQQQDADKPSTVREQASRSTTLANAGLGLAGAGAVAAVIGLVWYFNQPAQGTPPPSVALSPWALPGAAGGAGASLTGRF